MDRIPFGVAQLDRIIDGGAPPGSVVLLAGEAGAGAREFLYTCAVMNGLYHADPEEFELAYGSLEATARVPEEVHYVSFTASEAELERELSQVISAGIVEAASEAITFVDLSSTYFQLSPVPRSWYEDQNRRITEIGHREERRDTVEALGDYLDEHAAGNLVVIDSLSDLLALTGESLDPGDVPLLIKGLRRAGRAWNGLILLLVDIEAIDATQFGMLMGSADGTLVFEWSAGGNELDRTMVVKEFRGVLPDLEEEDIVRFETEIHDGGFDISDVRKIR